MSASKDSSSAVPSARVAASINCSLKRVTTVDDFDDSKLISQDDGDTKPTIITPNTSELFAQFSDDCATHDFQSSLSLAVASSPVLSAVPNPLNPAGYQSSMPTHESLFAMDTGVTFPPSLPPLSLGLSQFPSAPSIHTPQHRAVSHSDNVGSLMDDGGIFQSGDSASSALINSNCDSHLRDTMMSSSPKISLFRPESSMNPDPHALFHSRVPRIKIEESKLDFQGYSHPSGSDEWCSVMPQSLKQEQQKELIHDYLQPLNVDELRSLMNSDELSTLGGYWDSLSQLEQRADPLEDPGLVAVGREITPKQLHRKIKQLLRGYIWEILHGESPAIEHVARSRLWLRIHNGFARLDEQAVRPKAFRLRHSVLHRRLIHMLLHMCKNTELKKVKPDIGETLRHLYYQVRTDDNLFDVQRKSDRAILDICAMFEVNRGVFGLRADPRGIVCGALHSLKQESSVTSVPKRSEFSVGAQPISESLVNQAEKGAILPTPDALAILVIEKEAIINELVRNDLIMSHFILVSGKGYPDLNTRKFLWHLFEQGCRSALPCFTLVDWDPHGLDIHLAFQCGSIQTTESPKYALRTRIQPIGVDFGDIQDLCDLVMRTNDIRVKNEHGNQRGYPQIKDEDHHKSSDDDGYDSRSMCVDNRIDSEDAMINDDESDMNSDSEEDSYEDEYYDDQCSDVTADENESIKSEMEGSESDEYSDESTHLCIQSLCADEKSEDGSGIRGLISMPIPNNVALLNSHEHFLQSISKSDNEKLTSLCKYAEVMGGDSCYFKEAIQRWTEARISDRVKANIEAVKMILNHYHHGPLADFARRSPYSFFIWRKVLRIFEQRGVISKEHRNTIMESGMDCSRTMCVDRESEFFSCVKSE